MIVEANKQFNLTRITSPREAAIKHVLDSVFPWRLFADSRHILDAGSGAGFPGLPLALVLPEIQFTLAESTQKKARLIESVVETLALSNVVVSSQRAEDLCKLQRYDVITARALAPVNRALLLFANALKDGSRLLLYKGPDAEAEIADAYMEARKRHFRARLVERYDLPDALGTRTIVELAAQVR